jgi:hypothetical protein
VPAAITSLAPYQKRSEKAQANGYASLDGAGKVPNEQLPINPIDVGVARESGSGTNVMLGTTAGDTLTSGTNNVAIGKDALTAGTTTFENVAIGRNALLSNADGAGNQIAIGPHTLRDMNDTLAVANIAIGGESMKVLTVGNHNVGVGLQTQRDVTTGAKNNSFGVQALWMNIDGIENVAIGFSTLRGYLRPDRCVAVGNRALAGYGTALNPNGGDDGGTDNIAVGDNALANLTDGVGNICVGSQTGNALRSPDFVIAVGHNALNLATGGTDIVAIGRDTSVASNSLEQAYVIGRSATAAGSNVMVIGGSTADRRVSLALGNNGDPTTALGGGRGVISLQRAHTIPSNNPTDAVILYVDPADDKLKVRGESGTVTVLCQT